MSKLDWFTILVVGVCIAAILYLLYNMTNLFGDKNQAGDITEVIDTTPTDTYDYDTNTGLVDEESGDGGTNSDNGRINEGPGTTGGNVTGGQSQEGINYDDNEDPTNAENDNDDAAVVPTPSTPITPIKDAHGDEMRNEISSSLGNGRYMVIYGTFKYMASARRARAELRKKGFEDASIEIFDNGKYARVLVGRSNDYDTATELKSSLVRAGINDVIIQEKRRQR